MYEEATGEKPPTKSLSPKKSLSKKRKAKTGLESIVDIYNQHDRLVEENKQMKASVKENKQLKLSLKKLLAAFEELQTTNGTLKQTLEDETKIISDKNIETENRNERITELETRLAEVGGELEGLTVVHATCKLKLQERTENLLDKIYKKDKEVGEMQEKLDTNNTKLSEQVTQLTERHDVIQNYVKVLAEKNKTLNDMNQSFEEYKKSIVEQKDCIEKETMDKIYIKNLEIQNLREKCDKTEKILEDKCVVNHSLKETVRKLEKTELIQSLFDKNSKLSTDNCTLEEQVIKKNEENKGMQIKIESVNFMLNEKNELINKSNIILNEHGENIKKLDKLIEAKDKEIQIQKIKINTQNIENEYMSREINNLNFKNEKEKEEMRQMLLTEMSTVYAEKHNLEEKVKTKNEEIKTQKYENIIFLKEQINLSKELKALGFKTKYDLSSMKKTVSEKEDLIAEIQEEVTKKERLIENLHASLKEANEKLNASAQPDNDGLVENENSLDHSLEVFQKLAAATNESLESVCTMREEERNQLIQLLGIKTDNKGDERLQEVEERMEVERQRLRETEERLREEKERLVCIVCSVEEVGMVFSPCGHVTCCTTCAPQGGQLPHLQGQGC